MTAHFFQIAFTPAVKAAQENNGSRQAYAKRETPGTERDKLGDKEAAFIVARDNFYMASVSETGWPYVQHRGGPPGFVKVLGARTLGIADYRGNRQYVSVGNLAHDDRVALFFMDYPSRTRLKLLAHARAVDFHAMPSLAAQLVDAAYGAHVERGFLFEVEAFDWNCSQHITPRFTATQVEEVARDYRQRIGELESEIERLKS